MSLPNPHYRAALACGHCGRHVGDLEWDGEQPNRKRVLRATGEAPPPVLLGQRNYCPHCGGPAFAEAPERALAHALPVLDRARVNRTPFPQAS